MENEMTNVIASAILAIETVRVDTERFKANPSYDLAIEITEKWHDYFIESTDNGAKRVFWDALPGFANTVQEYSGDEVVHKIAVYSYRKMSPEVKSETIVNMFLSGRINDAMELSTIFDEMHGDPTVYYANKQTLH